MSRRNVACSGYIVKASDLTKILPKRVQEEYENAIEYLDWKTVHRILVLDENMPAGLPPVESVFVHGNEDSSEGELEKGQTYVTFHRIDLFTRTKTPELVALEKVGIDPKFVNWITWV